MLVVVVVYDTACAYNIQQNASASCIDNLLLYQLFNIKIKDIIMYTASSTLDIYMIDICALIRQM